jgi:hypothetical protein
MGRLDLNDKRVDWVSVTREYLNELYGEIAALREERETLQARVFELEFEQAKQRQAA